MPPRRRRPALAWTLVRYSESANGIVATSSADEQTIAQDSYWSFVPGCGSPAGFSTCRGDRSTRRCRPGLPGTPGAVRGAARTPSLAPAWPSPLDQAVPLEAVDGMGGRELEPVPTLGGDDRGPLGHKGAGRCLQPILDAATREAEPGRDRCLRPSLGAEGKHLLGAAVTDAAPRVRVVAVGVLGEQRLGQLLVVRSDAIGLGDAQSYPSCTVEQPSPMKAPRNWSNGWVASSPSGSFAPPRSGRCWT